MVLEKNEDLILYPCGLQLKSITDDTVNFTGAFGVSPSTITVRSRVSRSNHGILYSNTIIAEFAGLDNDTFQLLDNYCKDNYSVRALMTDGKVFEVASKKTPMDFVTSYSNKITSISMTCESLTEIKYSGNTNDQNLLGNNLTFIL
ncbi:hypothetical protein JCM19294_1145 [Nonlabens tegetincola]|uniref:Uncharacterized protein n=1 Tax=Nonlabens tegetincola TaxID=323273 RepID=A0A090QMS7_9FLAO|nr:hypothetical protein [Nonlabens tegetincola]GAK96836.1 hypothetical protein JCM19294_1145 [Nonlabens tegetincola]